MLCDDCKKRNAVIHMTKIVQGKKMELHLCEICGKEREQVSYMNDFSIHNFLANLLDTSFNSSIARESYQGGQCSFCGMTLAHFKQHGRLGCGHCYEVFGDKLAPLLQRVHGNLNHGGKIPKRAGGGIQIKRELKILRKKLQQAIEQEAFEEAATLRDQIRILEDQLQGA